MSGKNTAVFGIYADRLAVEEAVEHLRVAGFRSTDISVLFPDNQGTKDFAHEKNTKAPEGVTTGVVAGGITGGVLGWLTGIGALAIPGLGPFIAAGPIVAALAGAGAVGTLGGIVGALAGMGIPEYEAKRYEGRIRDGGVLHLRSLRQLRLGEAREGDPGTHRRAGHRSGERKGRAISRTQISHSPACGRLAAEE